MWDLDQYAFNLLYLCSLTHTRTRTYMLTSYDSSNSLWSHLPNAGHIDWIIQDLKDNSSEANFPVMFARAIIDFYEKRKASEK